MTGRRAQHMKGMVRSVIGGGLLALSASALAQTCPTAPPPMDVLLLMDNSGSIDNTEFNAAQQAIAQVANQVLSRPGYRLAVVNWACDNTTITTRNGCRIDVATTTTPAGGWSTNPADFAYVGNNNAGNRVCRSFGTTSNRSNCAGSTFTAAVPQDFAQDALRVLEGAMYSGGSTGGADSYNAATTAPSTPAQRLMIIHLTDAIATNVGSLIREVPTADAALGDYYYSNRFKNVRNALIVGVGINDTNASTTARQHLGAFSSRGGSATEYDLTHATAPSTLPADVGTPRRATFSATFDATQIYNAASSAFNDTLPACVVLRKQSVDGVGSFSFTAGTNGLPSSLTLTTTAPNTPVAAPTAYVLNAVSTDTGIRETISAGWSLSGVACLDASNASVPVTADSVTGQITIPAAQITPNARLTCTVTNARTGSITIVKDAIPDDAQDFAFTTTGTGLTGFSLDDDADATLLNTRTFSNLAPGSYSVTETALAGWSLTNLVCVDPDSGSTVNVGGRVATIDLDGGENITCTFTNAMQPRVTISKVSQGGVGTFSFTGSNGVAAQNITTVTAGTAVSGTVQTLTTASTATTLTEGTPPAGYALTGIACTGLPVGGTATPDLATRTVTLNAAATAPGANIACTFTNTLRPRVTISKVSQGGVGTFSFTGSNGVAAQNIATVTAGVAASGAVQTLTTANTATTLTEGVPPTGYTLTGIACTGLPAGGTATPDFATRTVTLNAAATAPGANIACTFTNTLRPRVTISKVSQGGVGTFSFTGSNGVAAQNIATVTAGVAASGAVQTLTTANTATTLTEGVPPAGYTLTGIACTGLPAGGTATPDLATRTLTLNAAATAPGANIACTFTNTLRPRVTISKVSQGGVGTFSFTGSNGVAAQNIATVTAGVAASGAVQTLTTANTATTLTEGVPPAGYTLTGIACTGLPAGGTATPDLATRTLTLNAAATAPGANVTCTFTNTLRPRVTIRKVSQGGVGTFSFTGSNGVAAQDITTVTAGTAVSGAVQTLTAANTTTTLTEGSSPAGYTLTGIACTGLPAGGTATPDLATRTLTLNAAATAPGANVTCTFTNTLQQTDLQVVKTVNPVAAMTGEVVTYRIVVSNNGPLAVSNAILSDTAGAGQDCTTPSTTATCVATGGASCPSATVPVSTLLGSGITIPTLPVGGQVTVDLQCTITATSP